VLGVFLMTHEILDGQTETQLKILDEISKIFETKKIEFWLRGGWAIDFILGKVTRLHDDIDLITWIQYREQIEDELLTAGYVKIPVKEEFRNRQSDFCKGNVEITFGYIYRSDAGNLMLNGLPEWIWRADSLLQNTYKLNDLSARVLNPTQLLEEKEVYEQIGRKTREKDVESKKLLRQIIDGNLF